MRYRETGELHKDFHGLVNSTVKYICDNFGKKALHKIFYNTGFDVYKEIREHLINLIDKSLDMLIMNTDIYYQNLFNNRPIKYSL